MLLKIKANLNILILIIAQQLKNTINKWVEGLISNICTSPLDLHGKRKSEKRVILNPRSAEANR